MYDATMRHHPIPETVVLVQAGQNPTMIDWDNLPWMSLSGDTIVTPPPPVSWSQWCWRILSPVLIALAVLTLYAFTCVLPTYY